jgi:hypothetical protein
MLLRALSAAKVSRGHDHRSGALRHEPAGEAREVTEVRRRDRSPVTSRFPRVIMTPSLVRELPIDPRVAFLLSRIDGQSSVETLVDVTGFDAAEVVSIVARLIQLGAITT